MFWEDSFKSSKSRFVLFYGFILLSIANTYLLNRVRDPSIKNVPAAQLVLLYLLLEYSKEVWHCRYYLLLWANIQLHVMRDTLQLI